MLTNALICVYMSHQYIGVAYYHLTNIQCLKALLTQEAFVTMVKAFVKSRVDYFSSLLHGRSNYTISRLVGSTHVVLVYLVL